MNPTLLALAIVALVAASAFLAVWSRRDTVGRTIAVALFVVSIPAAYGASVEMLGHHRPLWSAWDLPAGDHLVLGVKMVQDRAIYLYLDGGNREEPRPLILPWSNEQASKIQKAMDGAPEGRGGQFIMSTNAENGEMVAHPLPQPAAPPAKAAPVPGMVFEQ